MSVPNQLQSMGKIEDAAKIPVAELKHKFNGAIAKIESLVELVMDEGSSLELDFKTEMQSARGELDSVWRELCVRFQKT